MGGFNVQTATASTMSHIPTTNDNHMKHHSLHSGSYLIYARRSTDDQINQKNSIEYQIAQSRRFAETSGLLVAQLTINGFCENGVVCEKHTAFKTSELDIRHDGSVRYQIERPRFLQLVTLLARGEVTGVICLCWDRLSRNGQDDVVIKNLLSRGVDIRFVQTSYERSSAGALHMDIDGMFAAHYSRVSSERIRATNTKLRSEGKCPSRAPIGYLDRGPGDKPLDPKRAPAVRELFERYATGKWSFSSLTEWALGLGLTNKPRRRHRTKEEMLAGAPVAEVALPTPVTQQTIEAVLHNPFYAGFLRHRAQVMPGRHVPLISEALFAKVQRMCRARTQTVYNARKPLFTYRGIVRCTCRRLFTPYVQKGRTYYRSRCRAGCPRTRVNLREDALDEAVTNLLGGIALTDQELTALTAESPSGAAARKREVAAATRQRERELQKTVENLKYLTEQKTTLLREGVYTTAQYLEESQQLAGRAAELRSSHSDPVSVTQQMKTVVEFSELARMAQQSYALALPAERRAILLSVVSELVLSDGDLAEISAKDGFKHVLNRPPVRLCAPKHVVSELERLYETAKSGLEAMKTAQAQIQRALSRREGGRSRAVAGAQDALTEPDASDRLH